MGAGFNGLSTARAGVSVTRPTDSAMSSKSAKFRAWQNPQYLHYGGYRHFEQVSDKVRCEGRPARVMCSSGVLLTTKLVTALAQSHDASPCWEELPFQVRAFLTH